MRNPSARVPDFMTTDALALRAGVSRSTLDRHHRSGLVPASARTSRGQRLYTAKDAERLARLLSLRAEGWSLARIAAELGRAK